MKLKPDQLIDDRYKIIERLGQGGMGEVWKAIDVRLGDEVVIKIPLAVHDPEIIARFAGRRTVTASHRRLNFSTWGFV